MDFLGRVKLYHLEESNFGERGCTPCTKSRCQFIFDNKMFDTIVLISVSKKYFG